MKKDKIAIIEICIYLIFVIIALPFALINIISSKITDFILTIGEKVAGIDDKKSDYLKYCKEGEN